MLDVLARWLLTYSLHSTLLGLLVLFAASRIRRGDHRALALRVALFGALISATLPFQWTPPLSAWTAAPRTEIAAVSATPAPLLVAAEAKGLAAIADARPVEETEAAPPLAAPSRLPGAIAALLMAVAVFRLVRMVRSRRVFLKRLERGPLVDPLAQEQLDAWTAAAGHGPVSLSESSYARSPLALSSREICVPTVEWRLLSANERRGLIAHEFAHVLRRDPLWFLLAAASERVFWFLPLHGWLRRRAAAAAEAACDTDAAERLGSSLDFARCLAAFAELRTVEPLRLPAPSYVPAMTSFKSELVARVEALVQRPEPALEPVRTRRFQAVVAISAIAFACSAPDVSGDGSPGAHAADAPLRVQLDPRGRATLENPEGTTTLSLAGPDRRAGQAALRDWLEASTANAPRGGPASVDSSGRVHGAATSMPLLIRADESTPMKYVQWFMEQCGAPSVQLWDIRLESLDPSVPAHRIPLPVDTGIDGAVDALNHKTVEVRLRPSDDGRGLRYVLSTRAYRPGSAPPEEMEEAEEAAEEVATAAAPESQPIECRSLDEVRRTLKELGSVDRLTGSTIDPRRGTAVGDVLRVLDLLLEAGIRDVTFMGSFE